MKKFSMGVMKTFELMIDPTEEGKIERHFLFLFLFAQAAVA